MEQRQGGFGGGYQVVGLPAVDGADGNAVGGAGDEVADVLVAGERRHGGAVAFRLRGRRRHCRLRRQYRPDEWS